MFLHLGGDYVVFEKDIVAICDMDTSTTSKITCDLLKDAEKEGLIIAISNELPKSFIVTTQENMNFIYLSPISSTALRGRLENSGERIALGGFNIG